MIVYYSGTGNSRYCAEFLARHLEDQCIDAFHFIRDGIAAEFISGKPWVFVSPTYAWQLPRIFADFIRSGNFDGSDEAYFVMTCGSSIGGAGAYNKALCQEKGLRYRGTMQVVMPENYVAMFAVPQEEEAQRIVHAGQRALKKAARCIAGEEDIPTKAAGIGGKLMSGIVNGLFYPLFVKDKAFRVSDGCISCGKCVEGCVMNNIHLVEGKPVWKGNCTHCMACICDCPTAAIEYGRASVGKPRYHCPEVEE